MEKAKIGSFSNENILYMMQKFDLREDNYHSDMIICITVTQEGSPLGLAASSYTFVFKHLPGMQIPVIHLYEGSP